MSHARRFDHVGITVADLDTVTAFFVGLGLEVEGRMFVEGEFIDSVIGILDSRTEIVMLRPPDGGTGLELSSFVRPDHEPGSPAAMANELGLRNVAFEVDDLQAAVDRLAADGYGLVGGIGPYEHILTVAFRGSRSLGSSGPLYREAALSTSSSEWPVTDLLDPPENAYMRDLVGCIRDRVAVFLWSKQREILEAVVRHRYVAVKSAHDTGTGHGASRTVGWWLDTREKTRFNDNCRRSSRSTRFCGVHRPGGMGSPSRPSTLRHTPERKVLRTCCRS